MTKTDTAPTEKPFEQSLRRWSTALKLWRLCAQASCRRAQRCCGAARCCFPANFGLLPEGVRDFVDDLAEAQAEGLSFEAAMHRLDGTAESEALRAWNAAVAASVMRYSASSSRGGDTR